MTGMTPPWMNAGGAIPCGESSPRGLEKAGCAGTHPDTTFVPEVMQL